MDKKTRKRIKSLKGKLQACQLRLSGMKQQPDLDDDLDGMKREVAKIETELRQLREE